MCTHFPLSSQMCVVKEPRTGPVFVSFQQVRKKTAAAVTYSWYPGQDALSMGSKDSPHLPDALGLLPFCLPDNFISAPSLTQSLVVTGQ